jgi:hypothetical protein
LPDQPTADRRAFAAAPNNDPPAGVLDISAIHPIVSTGDQSSGTTGWVALTLEPGTCAALRFFLDRRTGVPHASMELNTVLDVA